MTKRIAMRWMDWTAVALVLWGLLSALPLSVFGYVPGVVAVTCADGQSCRVLVHRHIWRDIVLRYSVVVRDAESLKIACEGSSGPFPYLAQPAGSIPFSLVEWSAGDPRCANLSPGNYTMDTTWINYHQLPFVRPHKATVRSQFTVEQSR